jgi:hypothetical protein
MKMVQKMSDNYYIGIEINKGETNQQIEFLRKKLNEIASNIDSLGGNGNDFRIAALELGKTKINIDSVLVKTMEEIGSKVIDRIADRYLSFQFISGRSGDTVLEIESALRDKLNNIKIESNPNVVELSIMNKDFLMNRSIVTGDSIEESNEEAGLLQRGFMTEFSGASALVVEQDKALIISELESSIKNNL